MGVIAVVLLLLRLDCFSLFLASNGEFLASNSEKIFFRHSTLDKESGNESESGESLGELGGAEGAHLHLGVKVGMILSSS